MALLDPGIVNLGTEPISASAPAGESVRFDPQFEQLSAEIAKTESLTPVPIDWEIVTQISAALLKTKSKDYRIASYLALGLYQTRGFEGLLNALTAYKGLLTNFWETAFPEKARLRGRIGAVQWLGERLPPAMARKKAPASDEVALEMEQAALGFVSSVEECFANDAPQFVEMLQVVRAQADEVRARRAAEEAERQQREQKAQAPAAPEVVDPSDVDSVLEECRSRLFRVAAVVAGTDPASPLPFQITRAITWGWLPAAPPNEGGITQLPPPDPSVGQHLQQLASARDWSGIVKECESGFAERVFAFDLQRHCVVALAELGEPYASAKAAVVTALRGLLGRIPGLVGLKFVDGTPFFSPVAANWVDNEVLTASDGAGARKGGDDPELAKAVSEALRLSSSGDLSKALILFREGIAGVSRRRDRFLWRLELARLCMDSGKHQIALPLLTLLDEEVCRFALEEWEPELSLAVIQQLFHCRQKMASALPERPPEVERQLSELYQRLCRLDVNAALTVEF